jgi:predicted NAD/FAD-dependent oxidoreductase
MSKNTKPHIAIIGAGISGLVLAKRLEHLADVTLFEKSRGVSGRISTRYADPFQFDHGAQYFTARTPEFQGFLHPLIEAGLLADWQPKVQTIKKWEEPYKRDWFEPHYIAVPRMNAFCKHLAEGLDVKLSVEIALLIHDEDGWQLEDTEGERYAGFDAVMLAIPAPQVLKLLPPNLSLADPIEFVKMTPCYSLMLGSGQEIPFSWEAAVVVESAISWMAVNSSKEGRQTKPSILIQTEPEWSQEHIDVDREELREMLIREFCELTDTPYEWIEHSVLHSWLYAGVKNSLGEDCLWDAENAIGICGDWCIEGRVEAAFTSANALAERILFAYG